MNRRIVDIALKTPGVLGAMNIVGFSGATFTNASNSGAVFLVLDSFAKRAGDPEQSASGLQRKLNREFSAIQEAQVLVILPPPVAGIGNAGGFRMIVEDRAGRGSEALQEAVQAMMTKAGADHRRRSRCSRCSTPGRRSSISRSTAPRRSCSACARRRCSRRCRCISAPPTSTTSICSAAPSASSRRRRASTAPIRKDVLAIRVRNTEGDTVPLGSFTTVRDISGPYRVPRYNLYPSAELDGAAAPGYSQGQAIEIMQRMAAETLPEGFAYEWTTLAFLQLRAGDTAIFAFLLAVMFVFLVLAAQYESLMLPLAVILIVPMCLIASIVGVVLRGQDNNILTQVGFIVLIALAAKNAILIVEFAKQLEDRGRDKFAAAVEAARLRLRPILMTSFAFIFGVTPLVWAVGRRRRAAPDAGHHGVLRHDRGDVVRRDLHAGVLCDHALDRGAPAAAARRAGAAPGGVGGSHGTHQIRLRPIGAAQGGRSAAARRAAATSPTLCRTARCMRWWCARPHAHARFRLDAAKARAMPGVRLVLTGEDVEGRRPDADAGRHRRASTFRCRPIRCWRAARCATSAMRSPSWWRIRWSRRRTRPRPSTSQWEALPHVVGAVAALEQGAVAGLAGPAGQSRLRGDARRTGADRRGVCQRARTRCR